MNRRVAISLFLLAFVFQSAIQAQPKKNKFRLTNPEARGDQAVSAFDYEKAASFYIKALEISPEDQNLYLKIGECYRNTSQYEEAVQWFDPVFDSTAIEIPEIFKLRYAQSLMAVNRVEDATRWFQEHHKNDTLALTENRLAGLQHYDQFFISKGSIQINKLAINSPASDYGPCYYNNGLLFVSERSNAIVSNKKNPKSVTNGIQYSNLYYSKKNAEGDFEKPKKLNANINTDFHEGPMCIYNDEKNMVFTRNNYLNRMISHNKEGVNMLQLYFASQNKHGEWSQVVPYEHNNKNYSFAHPAMNQAGNLLVFASTTPGGLGGTDLYYSKLLPDSTWTKPVNLGPSVNTEGNEIFPSISGEKLFFASDGHPGIGGLDIYQTILTGEKVGGIENLGVPINSHADDFGYIEIDMGNSGFFTSNREDPRNDEIFEFFRVQTSLTIDLTDARTKTLIPNASVTVSLGNSNYKSWQYNGNKIRITTVLNTKHKVSITAPGYFDIEQSIHTGTENPEKTREFLFEMKRKPDFQKDSVQLVMNGTKIFMAFNGNVYTPKYGKDVYITDGIHDMSLGFSLTRYEHMKLANTLLKNGFKLKTPMVVDNIYYATNIYELRPQDKVILDEYVEVMKTFDEFNLFVNSHADSRGSKEYNLMLSEKRAQAARNYLIQKGIDEERLKLLFFGEHVPENDCIDGINCDEDDYQQNRKSELGFFVEYEH